MTWPAAAVRALVILAYFAALTVWLPSSILRLQTVAGSPQVVIDLVAMATWGLFVGLGMWGMRIGQRRGWI